MALMNVENLTIRLANKLVCQQFSWQVMEKQIWGILGVNGCGKTTLLHTLAGLQTHYQGQIQFKQINIKKYSRKKYAKNLAILLQKQNFAFPLVVKEIIMQGRYPHGQFGLGQQKQTKNLVQNILSQLDLENLQYRNIQTLSGGEQQRVALARILMQDTSMILLDEPSNHLDTQQKMQIFNLLFGLRKQNKSIIMVMHDLHLVSRFCTHIMLFFSNGEISIGKCADVLTAENLAKVYNHPFIKLQNGEDIIWLPK